MKITRPNAASTLLLMTLVPLAIVACGSHAANPGAGNSPSAHPASVTPSSSTPSPTPYASVVSSRVSYQWHWPNDVTQPGRVTHTYSVPPVPELVRISVGNHPSEPGGMTFNRMSFAFTTAFPSYRFEFTDKLISDGSGKVVPLQGRGVLKITFTQAQAHTADGVRSTIISEPARNLGLQRMVDYAPAGDFEGVLTYGIGVTWPIPHSNPQIQVRAYEVRTVTASGQHLYTVAIDVRTAGGGA
jgi:hypothetical protein